ncbi:MAG: hypothetical protein M3Z66_21240 [Chloroflexota bacterium]|nr:hypothetical protein [Chloroflexota bacterium]
MKFQFSEIVEHPDADLVLRVLEQQFREVSLETRRTGDQLTVYGLGPSYRTMNHSDKTVVRVTTQQVTTQQAASQRATTQRAATQRTGTQRAATLVQTDADFLASALMGTMAQDLVVRSKIERVLESAKTELKFEGVPNGAAPMRAAPDRSAALQSNPHEIYARGEPAAVVGSARAQRVEDPVAISTVTATPQDVSPAKRKWRGLLLTALAAAVLLIGAFYLLQQRYPFMNLFGTWAGDRTAPFVHRPTGSGTASDSPDMPAALPASASPAAAGDGTAGEGTDSEGWGKSWAGGWAAAIRTRDAEAQASFYADPVDRYLLNSNVSREELVRDKRAEIESRTGLWTFKAEDIAVEQKTASSAVLRLTKHIMVELPSSVIEEQHVRTQLKLRLIDGVWKIVSEQTLQGR